MFNNLKPTVVVIFCEQPALSLYLIIPLCFHIMMITMRGRINDYICFFDKNLRFSQLLGGAVGPIVVIDQF